VRTIYAIRPAHGRLLHIMTQLKLGLSFDIEDFSYSQFTLAGEPVVTTYALLGSFSLTALF
jgi:hypothetical protein